MLPKFQPNQSIRIEEITKKLMDKVIAGKLIKSLQWSLKIHHISAGIAVSTDVPNFGDLSTDSHSHIYLNTIVTIEVFHVVDEMGKLGQLCGFIHTLISNTHNSR